MGKHCDDLQAVIKGMDGMGKEEIKVMFLGIISWYLAQILDILEGDADERNLGSDSGK